MDHISSFLKHLLDASAIATMIATLVSWLPAIAALLSIVWTGLRIYEWFEVRRAKKAN